MKNFALSLLKFGFLIAAIFYVIHKVDTHVLFEHIKKADPLYLFCAFISLHIGAILSSLRLGVYLNVENFKISKMKLLSFYYIGLFFNTILPGGFSGDGYITIYFKKHFGVKARSLIRIMLSARANGLFFLNLFLYVFLWVSDYSRIFPEAKIVILVLFVLQIPVYILANKIYLSESFKVFLNAGIFSFISQIFSVLSMFFVLKAIGVTAHYVDYLTLFAISSIAAILPLTPGGAGLRELVFYKGASVAGIDPELAVSGSLIYFAVYFVTSLFGIIFYLRKPKYMVK